MEKEYVKVVEYQFSLGKPWSYMISKQVDNMTQYLDLVEDLKTRVCFILFQEPGHHQETYTTL